MNTGETVYSVCFAPLHTIRFFLGVKPAFQSLEKILCILKLIEMRVRFGLLPQIDVFFALQHDYPYSQICKPIEETYFGTAHEKIKPSCVQIQTFNVIVCSKY